VKEGGKCRRGTGQKEGEKGEPMLRLRDDPKEQDEGARRVASSRTEWIASQKEGKMGKGTMSAFGLWDGGGEDEQERNHYGIKKKDSTVRERNFLVS